MFQQVASKIDDRVAERNGAYAGLPWGFDSKWAGRDAAQDAKTICEMLHAAAQYYPQVVMAGGMISGSSDESSIKGLTLNAGTILSHENIAAIRLPQAWCNYRVDGPYSTRSGPRKRTLYAFRKYEILGVVCTKYSGWCGWVYRPESVENVAPNIYT